MFGLMRVTLTSAGRFRRFDGAEHLLNAVGLSEDLRNLELPGWAGLSRCASSLSPMGLSRPIRASIPCLLAAMAHHLAVMPPALLCGIRSLLTNRVDTDRLDDIAFEVKFSWCDLVRVQRSMRRNKIAQIIYRSDSIEESVS